jgi:hypothetical protein
LAALAAGRGNMAKRLVRTLCVIALGISAFLEGAPGPSANAQDKPHWLVGTWVGDVEGQRSSRLGTTRTMKIEEVMPDGTLKAGWAATGEPKIGNATARFSGERVELVTNENTKVELSKTDDSTMRGTFTPAQSGRSYTISMKKQ